MQDEHPHFVHEIIVSYYSYKRQKGRLTFVVRIIISFSYEVNAKNVYILNHIVCYSLMYVSQHRRVTFN